jgi:hypothetical protein
LLSFDDPIELRLGPSPGLLLWQLLLRVLATAACLGCLRPASQLAGAWGAVLTGCAAAGMLIESIRPVRSYLHARRQAVWYRLWPDGRLALMSVADVRAPRRVVATMLLPGLLIGRLEPLPDTLCPPMGSASPGGHFLVPRDAVDAHAWRRLCAWSRCGLPQRTFPPRACQNTATGASR